MALPTLQMNFRSIAYTLLLLIAGAAAPQLSASQDVEDVQLAIDSGNAYYIEAMAIPDARALANIFDEDGYRLAGGGEVVRGRHSILRQMGEFFTRVGPIDTNLETIDLWVVDSLAYETGIWSYTFTPPGDARRTIGGHYVTVWKQQADSTWKILAEMGVPGTEQ